MTSIAADPPLNLGSEMLEKTLDRPRCCITKRANRVAFDLFGDLIERVDLADIGIAGAQPWRATTSAPQPLARRQQAA